LLHIRFKEKSRFVHQASLLFLCFNKSAQAFPKNVAVEDMPGSNHLQMRNDRDYTTPEELIESFSNCRAIGEQSYC